MKESLKDKTAKGLFWGALNNGGMQLLNVVFGIIIARRLTPGDFGLVAMLLIYSSIASNIQESGFITALINRRNATHEDYNSVFWFNIVVGVLLYVILFFLAPLIAAYNHQSVLIPLSRYLFIGFFVGSFAIAPRAKLMKELKVKEQTIISLSSLLISGIVGVIMVYCGFAYWGIATRSIVYVLFVSVLSWYFTKWRPCLSFSIQPIKEMFGFSVKILVTKVCENLNNYAFETFLGRFYAKSEVGEYSQANNWNQKGNMLITGMVQSVAQPMFVAIRDQGDGGDAERQRLANAFRKMLRFTCFIAFPIMFGLILVAPEFIVVTIKEQWLGSAHLMRILCFGGAFLPIVALYKNLIISRGKSNVYMWNVIAQVILILADLYLVQKCHLNMFGCSGIKLMVVFYVVITIGWMFVWQWFVQKEIDVTAWQALKDILPFMLIAAATMVLTYLATCFISNMLLLLCARVVVAAIIYIAILWLLDAKILRECVSYIKKK